MSSRLLIAAAVAVLLLPTQTHAAETPTLTLRSEVVVGGEQIRMQDLSQQLLDPALGSQVVFAAPRAGFTQHLERGALLRRFVQAGIRPMPHLGGARVVSIRRSGGRVAEEWVREELRRILQKAPLPERALEQEWVITRVPALRGADTTPSIRVHDLGPLVGRGSLRFITSDSDGNERKHFASVQRRLRTLSLRLEAPVERGLDLNAAPVATDTLWVDSAVDWERLHRPQDGRAGWSLRRSLAAGTRLERNHLRPTDIVHRGQRVEWRVRQGELAISLSVKARSDGALGEWILVQSPLDDRLKRVCVVGPGQVSQRPSSPRAAIGASGDAVEGERP